jgi:hypothetical protein
MEDQNWERKSSENRWKNTHTETTIAVKRNNSGRFVVDFEGETLHEANERSEAIAMASSWMLDHPAPFPLTS